MDNLKGDVFKAMSYEPNVLKCSGRMIAYNGHDKTT